MDYYLLVIMKNILNVPAVCQTCKQGLGAILITKGLSGEKRFLASGLFRKFTIFWQQIASSET